METKFKKIILFSKIKTDERSITFYWPTNALNCIKLKG